MTRGRRNIITLGPLFVPYNTRSTLCQTVAVNKFMSHRLTPTPTRFFDLYAGALNASRIAVQTWPNVRCEAVDHCPHIVNIFEQIKSNYTELIKELGKIELRFNMHPLQPVPTRKTHQPSREKEFDQWLKDVQYNPPQTPVERAATHLAFLQFAHAFKSPAFNVNGQWTGHLGAHDILRPKRSFHYKLVSRNCLTTWSALLKNEKIQYDCKDAVELIPLIPDDSKSFVFAEPPYPPNDPNEDQINKYNQTLEGLTRKFSSFQNARILLIGTDNNKHFSHLADKLNLSLTPIEYNNNSTARQEWILPFNFRAKEKEVFNPFD